MSDTTIQIRRDTAANWSSVNPILADGELGLDQTNTLIRVGDGATDWNSLTNKFLSNPADATHDGYLTSVDWNTFNNKVPSTRLINTTAPLLGGGDLSADLTLSIQSTSLQNVDSTISVTGGWANGILGLSPIIIAVNQSALDISLMTGTLGPTRGGTGITSWAQGDILYCSTSGPPGTPVLSRLTKNTSATRYLSNTGTSNNPAWAQINLTNGVTGILPSGNLNKAAADGATLGIAAFTAADFNDNGSGVISIDYANGQKATTSQPGFLTSTDWNTFNGKQNALTFGNLTEATSAVLTITGGTGAVIGTGTSIQVTQSTTSTSGYLSSTDWNTFNNKQPAITGVQGDILYFSGTNTLANLAKNTTASRYLSNSGSSNNPAWAQVDLTNGVTGTLPVGNGGTGTATAFTAGSVIFAGTSGVYSQNNSKFFWDNTNNALCLGTTTQAGLLTTVGATGAANTAGQVGASITGGVGGTSGNSTAAGAGGAITITTGLGGVGSSSGAGGAGGLLTLKAGNGAAGGLGNAGIGGGVTIQSGNGTVSSSGALATSVGGTVLIASGTGGSGTGVAGSSSGGPINITTGAGGSQSTTNGNAGAGGAINITVGNAGSNSTSFGAGTPGGNIALSAGSGSGSPSSVPGGAGGAVNITSGVGGNSNGAAGGAGGAIAILANSAGSSGASGANGGSVTINPGAGTGTGTTGTVSLCNTRGNAAVGNVSPTARLHIAAGTATASSAPLKFSSGTNLTTAETGAVEYNGTNLFFTRSGTTRESVFTGNDAATAPTTTAGSTFSNFYGSSSTNVLGTPNSWASVVINGTTYKIPLYT